MQELSLIIRMWENLNHVVNQVESVYIIDNGSCNAGEIRNLPLNKTGYKICRVNTVSLLHELGNLKCRKIAERMIYVTNHSAFRRYDMSKK